MAGLVVLGALTGCTAAGHAIQPPRSASATQASPSASAPALTASAAEAAFQRECTGFDAAYRQIQQVSPGGHLNVARLEKLTAHGLPGWSSQLLAAARAARAPGVPLGHNRARDLAVAIDKVANAVVILEVDAGTHRATIINRDWSRVQAQVAAVRATGCS